MREKKKDDKSLEDKSSIQILEELFSLWGREYKREYYHQKKGFVPFQIGIGTHYEKNPMFSDWVQFQDYTQMTTDVVKLIRRRIAKMLKV